MSSSRVERKLAAIMFTDIVGYTALSAKDETKALKLLDIQKQILNPIIEEFNGTLHKEMGDGLLFTFPTVTEAVKCGIKIQEQTKANDDLNLRIGIHEGEISLKDGDVLGDDVNVSSRIEPFSAVGGIAISGKVQQNISSLTEYETKYIGKPKLKGVSQKVEVYCITSHGLPQTDLSKVSAKLEKKSNLTKYALIGGVAILVGILFFVFQEEEETVPSIAIIPLENKGESKDEFYSYSISSDLISDVSGAGDIRVASLKDIEKLDYKSLTNSEIAKKLYVRYISQGTLWKVDSIFQLSMELFDTKKNKIKWSKNWQQNWSELPSIKGGLSENILNNLEVETKQDIIKSESENAEAYELYLKAKNIYEKRQNTDDIKLAQGLLNKAIELDKNLIAAHLILGDSYREVGDFDKAMDIYSSALTKAEKLGDKLWIGRSTRKFGYKFSDTKNFDKALEFYEKSYLIAKEIGDKQGMGLSLNSIGAMYSFQGKYDKATEYYRRSLNIKEELGDQSGTGRVLMNIGLIYFNKGDFEKTLEYYERSLGKFKGIDDKFGIGMLLNNIGIFHQNQGNYNKALNYFKRSLTIREELGNKGRIGGNLTAIGFVYYRKGEYDKALDYYIRSLIIREELGDKRRIGQSLNNIGVVHKNKGDYDKALDYYIRSLAIKEELGDKRGIGYSLNNIGNVHYDKGGYNKAMEYLAKSLDIQKEIGIGFKSIELFTTTYLYLSYRHLSRDYDEKHLRSLIKETQNIEFDLNFRLYELLEDTSYLETAYNQVQEKVSAMEKELAEKYLSYPIPKQIVEEWEKLNK